MLRETKAGGGEAQEGAGKAEQGCLGGTGMALTSPARQGWCGDGAQVGTLLCAAGWIQVGTLTPHHQPSTYVT